RAERDPLAAWLRRVLHDLDRPAQLLLDPGLAGAGVALVDPDVPQPGELLGGALQEERHARPVPDRRVVDRGPQHQPLGLDQEVALAAADPLGPVVAAHPTDRRGLDRLAVDDARARLA